MYNHSYSNYQENEVLSADPLKLVELLHRGTIDALSAARSCLQNHDIAGRSRQISKACALINELAHSLDHAKGEAISRSLAELYDYSIRRLNEANFKQVEQPLQEVSELFTTLLTAWQQCRAAAGAPPVSQKFIPEPAADYVPLVCSV